MKPLYEVEVIVRFRGDPGEGGTYAHAIQDGIYNSMDLYPMLEVLDIVGINRRPGEYVYVDVLVGMYTIAKSKKKAFNIACNTILDIAQNSGIQSIDLHDAHVVLRSEPLFEGWGDAGIFQNTSKKQTELTHRQYLDLYWGDEC
jgi:hypothetical protein